MEDNGNKFMKAKTISAIALASILVTAAFALPAYAKPPGETRHIDVGKMLFKLNVIVHPNSWVEDDTVCSNSGHRIFFSFDETPWFITWLNTVGASPDFKIKDCDGTTDGTAVVEQNEGKRVYVLIRVLGPNKVTNNLNLTCAAIVDVNPDPLCLIGTENFNKKKEFTKISQNIVDNENEEILFTVDPDTGVKIFELRVYEKL